MAAPTAGDSHPNHRRETMRVLFQIQRKTDGLFDLVDFFV